MMGRNNLLHVGLEHWAKTTPGKIALIDFDSGQQLLYRQLKIKVDQLVSTLWSAGVRHGDRIMLFAPMNLSHILLLYASSKAWRNLCSSLPGTILFQPSHEDQAGEPKVFLLS